MASHPRRVWGEIFLLLGLVVVALLLARGSWTRTWPGVSSWLIPAVLLYAPLGAVLLGDRDFKAVGLGRPERRALVLDQLLLLLFILPLFLAGWWILMKYWLGRGFHFHWPREASRLLLWQFLGVALPEEVFFRGYLQGRLNQLLKPHWALAGMTFGPGLFLSALLFSLAHGLVEFKLTRLLVFFPGLLFGVFRERENSVVGPVLAHGLCNFSFLVAQAALV